MANLKTDQKIKSITVEATIIRADGTREELGVISSWHRNPIKRATSKLKAWRH